MLHSPSLSLCLPSAAALCSTSPTSKCNSGEWGSNSCVLKQRRDVALSLFFPLLALQLRCAAPPQPQSAILGEWGSNSCVLKQRRDVALSLFPSACTAAALCSTSPTSKCKSTGASATPGIPVSPVLPLHSPMGRDCGSTVVVTAPVSVAVLYCSYVAVTVAVQYCGCYCGSACGCGFDCDNVLQRAPTASSRRIPYAPGTKRVTENPLCHRCDCERHPSIPGTNKAACLCTALPPCYVDYLGKPVGRFDAPTSRTCKTCPLGTVTFRYILAYSDTIIVVSSSARAAPEAYRLFTRP